MTFRRMAIACAWSLFVLYAGLVLSLFCYFEPARMGEGLLSERTLFSIRLSLWAATLSTGLSMVVAVPAAFALSRHTFRGSRMVDTLLELPMIVSPAALGAMLLIFFTNPVGVWLQEHVTTFVFTAAGVVLAQFVTTAGVATRLVKAALDEIPRRYENVAQSLGATPTTAFVTVTLPLSKRGLLAAAVLTWAKALGEFGATITIAGSMSMKTETLPVAIFMRLSSADIEGTVVLITILVSIGLCVLYAARALWKEPGIA